MEITIIWKPYPDVDSSMTTLLFTAPSDSIVLVSLLCALNQLPIVEVICCLCLLIGRRNATVLSFTVRSTQ